MGNAYLRPGIVSAVLNVTPLGAVPAGITATVNSPTMLTVRWNTVPETVGYVVRVVHPTSSDPDMSFMRIVPTSGLRVLQFDGLQPNVRYLVSVAGIWDAGQGLHENSSGIRCTIPEINWEADTVVLPEPCTTCGWVRFREGLRSAALNAAATAGPAPASLRVVQGTLTDTSVQLAWNPVSNTAVRGYLISKDGAPIDFITKEEFARSSNTWAYHGLMPGVLVRFSVQACWDIASFPTINGIRIWDGFGRPGIASNILSVTAPDGGRLAPAGVRVVANSPTEITVSWDAVSGAHGYRVELLLGGRVEAYVTVGSAVRTARFGMGDVNPNTAYQVRVVGIWNVGTAPAGVPAWQWEQHRDGRASALVNVRTTAPAVTGLRVAIATDGISFDSARGAWSVRLAWNPPPGADAIGVQGYLVWRDNVPVRFVTAQEFAAARNTWTDDTAIAPGARVVYAVQPVWGTPGIDPVHDFDARGNWIPNGKPGIRTANLTVVAPLP